MTEIRMLRKAWGAPNFVKSLPYEKGWHGDVPEHLAKAFVEEMDPPAAEYVTIEAKAVPAAPENKMLAGAEENKVAEAGEDPAPDEPENLEEPEPDDDEADIFS